MEVSAELMKDNINRRGWLLCAATFAVVLALASAVTLLFYPLVRLIQELGGARNSTEGYYAIVGLAGLVLIFCLYVVLKQHELMKTRDALELNERGRQEASVRLSELSALFQVSTTLNLQLQLNVILEIIVRRVVSTLRAQHASIMIYNAEEGGEGIAGWVAQRKEAVLLNDSHPQLGRHIKSDRNITSSLSLPLRLGDRVVGVLNVNRINNSERFTEHHREMLRMFAEHVGAVIDRAETVDRLTSRTRVLEAANLRLSEMNQMKDVFLSTASHELKTPLSSVIAYAELLEDNAEKLKPDQRAEFLRRLRAEAGRLLGLIEDILDLSRIESGKLTLRRVPLSVNEVVRAAVETARPTATKHTVELVEALDSELPPLLLDEVKMRQVVVNLLVNAIRFSPEHGTVKVVTRREPKFMLIEVVDQGPGILPEETVRIFELFGQGVSGLDRRTGGLGIGLHLVRRISELHGAHVGVNSQPGSCCAAGGGAEGSVEVRLPGHFPPAPPAVPYSPGRWSVPGEPRPQVIRGTPSCRVHPIRHRSRPSP
ncbi:MAG: GAF domain-containing sensor histidine kinase [Candidatus Eisenbacteria bacterium]|uniref:histidine kinase n=1 Tax=Eiseniibacteriota bacterium TaxID=2212470 RepID=A0A538T571_UNCEI|nr:MAG: GAF domain-containing sensor histidine kinase [Candidatus Eisenbacteria bacterium]